MSEITIDADPELLLSQLCGAVGQTIRPDTIRILGGDALTKEHRSDLISRFADLAELTFLDEGRGTTVSTRHIPRPDLLERESTGRTYPLDAADRVLRAKQRFRRTPGVRKGSIAVIVPVYEGADQLHTMLASIAGQTRPPDRVVVADDGSSDDPASVVTLFGRLLPVEMVRLEQNVGIAAARRAAIERCDEDLLALADHDDVWFPDHLAQLERAWTDEQVIVTACPIAWFAGTERPAVERVMRQPPPDKQYEALLHGNFLFVGSLFSRRLYDRVGGFRNDPPGGIEDWDLWIRMVRVGATVCSPAESTVLYRRHDRAVSGGQWGLLDQDLVFLEALLDGLSGREARLVRRALRDRRSQRFLAESVEASAQGKGFTARWLALRALLAFPDPRPTPPRGVRTSLRAGVQMVLPNYRERRSS